MNNKLSKYGKQTFYALLVTVVLLVLTVSLYIFSYIQRGGSFSSSTVVVAIALVALGVIALVVVYYKQGNRDKNVKKLNEQFYEIYEQVKEYVGLSPLNYFEKQELKDEILYLFLQAQKDNKNPQQVIGEDHTEFIKNMIRAHGTKNTFFNDILTGLQFYVIYIFLVTGLLLIEGKNTIFNISIDYTVLFFFAVASFVIIPIAFSGKRKAIINIKSNSYFISVVIGIIVAVAFVGVMRIVRINFSNIIWVKDFLDGSFVVIKSPLHLIALLAVIPLIQLIKYSMRKFK